MGRKAGLELSMSEKRVLNKFLRVARDAREYRAALGILLRAEKKSAGEVGKKLGVTIKQVFMWCKKFKEQGVNGLKVKKQTGRPARSKNKAKKILPDLLKQDPQAFGFLKGKWVLRDISQQLKKEGIDLNYTGVRRALEDLGIVQKMPKLRTLGSLVKNYKKREEIRRYRQIAGALLKKR